MSKKIKDIVKSIDELEIDDSIKELFKGSIDSLNDEFKSELTRTKTKLNESFAEREAGYLSEMETLKKVEPKDPNQELLDQIKVVKGELKAEKEHREKVERERMDAIKESKLHDIFKDSIDAELLTEKYKSRVKIVNDQLFSDDDDMTPISEIKEQIKTERPHLWKAAGVGGSGTTGKSPAGGIGDISVDGMDLAAFRANKDSILKAATNK